MVTTPFKQGLSHLRQALGTALLGRPPAAGLQNPTPNAQRLTPGPRRSHGTLGFSSPSLFSALAVDDFKPELRGKAAWRLYDEMRRSDGQVRAIHSVIGLPIRATRWHLEPPARATAAEQEAAERLQANLFGGMETPFDAVLRELLRAVYFGVAVPELEWGEEAGWTSLVALHSRNLDQLESWLYAADGRLVGYLLAGNRVVGRGLRDALPTLRYERAVVPLHRCIHAVFEGENGSPVGFALARSLYQHWFFKKAAYFIAGVGLERNWLGVPVGKADPGASWDDRAEILEILSRLRATENGAIALPAGWNLEWFESTRSLTDIMPLLHHQDALMARAALAQMLVLGQAGVGTQALAREHTRLFLQAEDAIARWIAEVLNRQLVRRWSLLNYGEGFRAPVLRHRPIREQDPECWARALHLLEQGAFVTPTAEDEAHVRALIELPELPPDQLTAARSPRGGSHE